MKRTERNEPSAQGEESIDNTNISDPQAIEQSSEKNEKQQNFPSRVIL